MLVSTKDGRKYTLAGDYDNIRENLGRTVTVWALPPSGQGSQSQTASSRGSSSPSQTQTPGNTESTPVAVTVRSIQRISETCDSAAR